MIKITSLNTESACKLAFKIDSLKISPSKIYALWGLSGHGKSLLLSLLAGYPNSQWLGKLNFKEFSFFSEDFEPKDFYKNSSLHKKFSSLKGKIIYMPQQLPQDKTNNLSIEQELPFLLKAISPSATKAKIEDLKKTLQKHLNKAGQADILTKQIHTLSGGERKRLEILIRIYGAKSLAKDEPCLILLDEPTSGLDVKNERDFLGLIRDEFNGENLSIIISTHSASLLKEENNLFDEHILMQDCTLKYGLSKDEIYRTLTAKQF